VTDTAEPGLPRSLGTFDGVALLVGITIGSGEIGPMTKRLSELYAEETATSGYQIMAAQPDAG
tara:strand:+ start:626 stop:814 length:189 start_codon:yes stop_codon:yes gene_type:complete